MRKCLLKGIYLLLAILFSFMLIGDIPVQAENTEKLVTEELIAPLNREGALVPAYFSANEISVYTTEVKAILKQRIKNAIDTGTMKFDVSDLGLYRTLDADIHAIANAVSQVLVTEWRYFYVTGRLAYTYDSATNKITSGILKYYDAYKNADGTLNTERVQSTYTKYEAAIEAAKSVTTANMTDVEKALAVHDYLILECDYDQEGYLNGTIQDPATGPWGVLIDGVAVCQGYAEAYSIILKELGIDTYLVASASMNHAWNLVYLDNHWYHADLTWDDPVWPYTNDYANEGYVRHYYFLRSDAEFRALEHYGWDAGGLTADVTNAYGSYNFYDIGRSMYYYNGYWYYKWANYDSVYVAKRKLSDGLSQSVITLSDKPKYVHGVNGYLYYATDKKIYEYNLTTGQDRLFIDMTNPYPGYNIEEFGVKQQRLTVVLHNASTNAYEKFEILPSAVKGYGVQLDKANAVIAAPGQTLKLKASLLPSYASNKTVSWTSSNPSVATVDGSGLVTAVGYGTSVITVRTAEGNKTATCNITVGIAVSGIQLDRTEAALSAIGQTLKLNATIQPSNATNKNVTWSSSNTAVATVDSTGLVKAVGEGVSIITATTADGNKTAQCKVTVRITTPVTGISLDKTSLSITNYDTNKKLTATVTPGNAENRGVTWSSSNSGIVQVDANGTLTAVDNGTVTITARTVEGGYSASCMVQSEICPTGIRLSITGVALEGGYIGRTYQVEATVSPANAANKNIIWTSTNPAVATVDSNGLVTVQGNGYTQIKATTEVGGFKAACAVEVSKVTPNPNQPSEPEPSVPEQPSDREAQVRAFVERMYTIVLNRAADENGLNDWAAGLIELRVDGAKVVDGFVNSAEFRARNLNNSDYIKTLYRAILNREPGSDEVNLWLMALAQGQSRQDLLDGFVTSAEFDSLCDSYGIFAVMTQEDMVRSFASRMYTVALNRPADEAGLNYWVSKLMSGSADGAAIADGFINSSEFRARNLSNTDYIKTLYLTFLNREADAAGLSNWLIAFRQGYSRMEILNAFIETAEFGALCESYGIRAKLTQRDRVENFVARMYTVALNRAADVNGLNDWTTGLMNGVIKGAEVAEGFILSAEFESRNVSSTDFVKILYRTFFNREGSDQDILGWTNALDWYDYSRRDVLKGFVNSDEFGALCGEYGILQGVMH